MQKNTRKDTLIELFNEQQALVLSRKAGIRVLEKMFKEDPDRVLVTTPDFETLAPKAITVRARLEEMNKTLKIDEDRLEAYAEMIEEETTKEESEKKEVGQTGNSEVEKG